MTALFYSRLNYSVPGMVWVTEKLKIRLTTACLSAVLQVFSKSIWEKIERVVDFAEVSVCDYKKQINKNNTLIGEYQSEIIKAQKSEQGHSNSDIMKLKQKIAVLNNENKKLKNDLKQLNSLK